MQDINNLGTVPCVHCDGTGQSIDHAAVGAWVRGLRLRKRLTLREVGVLVGWKIAYISDLENGRRLWTQKRLNLFVDALESK